MFGEVTNLASGERRLFLTLYPEILKSIVWIVGFRYTYFQEEVIGNQYSRYKLKDFWDFTALPNLRR